ncbi:MAG: flagellar assembly protein A [Campylobacterota bacterium]|nr:flagellar assembly protein A [Campylobacterota bacterium]
MAEKSKLIKPVVVHTDNVARELLRTAHTNKVHVDTLDFLIYDISTYARSVEEMHEGEWLLLDEDDLDQYQGRERLVDGELEFKQEYDIEIFTKVENDAFSHFYANIGANTNVTSVYLAIKAGSILKYYDELKNDFETFIMKKKLRANIMLMLFSEDLDATIDTLIARVRIASELVFAKKEVLLIAQGVDIVPTIDDKLINHIENRNSAEDEYGRIDYSNRGFVLATNKDDLIFEYIKVKEGKSGRDCRGKFLEAPEPRGEHEPTFTFTENIRVEEDDETTKFFANISGYIVEEGGKYDIDTRVDVEEITFKSTGKIDAGTDSDITINVKQDDVFKDAVGTGIEVNVKEIDIEGGVGAKAKVHASKAKINGQTHKESYIEADDMFIKIHKGRALGKSVKIDRLEHGTVEAEEVTIEQALGGRVKAKRVTINTLGSHVTMEASEFIKIGIFKGSENKFIIDPIYSTQLQEELNENNLEVETLERRIRQVQEEADEYEELIEKSKISFLELKKKIVQLQKNRIKVPTPILKKYKQFRDVQEKYKELNGELSNAKTLLEKENVKHLVFQEKIFGAKITSTDYFKGHNEIIYRLVNPKTEIKLNVNEGSSDRTYMLVENEFGAINIEAVEDDD